MARILITPTHFYSYEMSGKLTSFYIEDRGIFYYINKEYHHESVVTILKGDVENE